MGCCVPEPKMRRRPLPTPRSERSESDIPIKSPRHTDEDLMNIHHDTILQHMKKQAKETMT